MELEQQIILLADELASLKLSFACKSSSGSSSPLQQQQQQRQPFDNSHIAQAIEQPGTPEQRPVLPGEQFLNKSFHPK